MFHKQLSTFRRPVSIGQAALAQTNKGSAVGGGAAYSQTHTDFLTVGLPEHLTATGM